MSNLLGGTLKDPPNHGVECRKHSKQNVFYRTLMDVMRPSNISSFFYCFSLTILLLTPWRCLPQSLQVNLAADASLGAKGREYSADSVESSPIKSAAVYDESLYLLVSRGLISSPLVRSKLKLVEMAKFGVDTAKWQFYPTPSASIQQARTANNDPSYGGSVSQVMQLAIQQPIWTGGRLTAGLTLAEKKLALASIDLESIKQQVALEIVNGFGAWSAASQKFLAYEKNVASHRELKELIRRRINSGLSPESDYVFSKGRLDQALADLGDARTQMENSLVRLTQLLGARVEDSDLSSIKRPMLSYPVSDVLMLQNALKISPLVLRAKIEIEMQDSQILIAKSSAYPSLSLSLQRQNGDFSYSNVTTNAENRLFLSLSTNFGAGLSNFSQVSAAIAQRDSAELDEDFAKRNLTQEILSDIALLKSSEYRVKASESACNAASSTSESWQRQFLVGRKGWQDLLNSTRELANCQATLADAKQSALTLSWKLAIFSMGLNQALNLTVAK